MNLFRPMVGLHVSQALDGNAKKPVNSSNQTGSNQQLRVHARSCFVFVEAR